MSIQIKDYDELRAFILNLRGESAAKAQDHKTPQSRSFHNGMVHACDQIYVALLSWEKSWESQGDR